MLKSCKRTVFLLMYQVDLEGIDMLVSLIIEIIQIKYMYAY